MTIALTSLEVAALVRDIVLITFFVIGIIGLILILVLGLAAYQKAKNMMDRVDAGVDRVEAMVDKVDSTTENVKKTATYMNRGMRASDIARSAVGAVFGRSGDDPGKSNGKSDRKDR